MRLPVQSRRLAAALLVFVACGDDPPPCTMFQGECIGVPPTELCDDDHCTDGVPCTEVIALSDGDDLASSAASAAPGSCIALAEGTYGGATLSGGVSLLGKAASLVTVGPLSIDGGSGAVVRGVRVQGNIMVRDAAARIEAVRIEGASDGITTQGVADLTVIDSEIEGAQRHGIVASDAKSVTVQRTLLRDLGGPGLWVQCGTGCDCPSKPMISVDHVRVERARHVGVSLIGTTSSVHNVAIVDTRQVTQPVQLPGGGAFLAAGCTELDVTQLEIAGAVSFGIMVDGANGNIGNEAESKGIIIVGTKVGMWLSNIDVGLTVAGADITTTQGVGIGIGGNVASKGIIIVGTKVGKTERATLLVEPAVNGEKKEVGHGFVWGGGAEVHVNGLTLAGNAIASMVIDGPVGIGSTLANVSLIEGDEQKGIVQQNVLDTDPAPATEGTTPPLSRQPTQVADVPASPQAPVALE